MSRKKLGRGLQALLGVDDPAEPSVAVNAGASEHEPKESSNDLRQIPVANIEVNPYQPRRDFDPEELASLARSISTHGVIQPIVVRALGSRYQLVAGERRLRAAKEAGLSSIPARVLVLDDQQTCELALIENLQRQDLNAIEKAQAFQNYLGQFGSTHEELAEHLGIDRSSVTNLLRLLELPDSVQDAVRTAKISFGHARALLSLADPVERIAVCDQIVAEALSVRQTESLVKTKRETPAPSKADNAESKEAADKSSAKSNHVLSLENDLRHRFGTKVEILPEGSDYGRVVIHFQSHDDFERVLELLQGKSGGR
ncbi:MAG: ParB/RepB/Spo0J family partition protein [Planctomycetota bacterium]